MNFPVHFAKKVRRDLEDIRDFIDDREGEQRSIAIIDGLLNLIESLKTQPRRGHTLPEFAALGLNDILELHFKPYRVVYHVDAKKVTVLLVVDGRRNMTDLLARRVLR